MRIYLKIIQYIQRYLLVFSIIFFLILMPSVLAFYPDFFTWETKNLFFQISLISVTFVMIVRPLADIFKEWKFIRPLVILRKSFGVLSASIIVGYLLSKIILSGGQYFYEFLTPEYWSTEKYSLLAHLGDWTAIILLITSNDFSKQILRKWWKKIQKLAYIYFYTGAFYELLVFNQYLALWSIVVVSVVVIFAFIINNRFKKKKNENN